MKHAIVVYEIEDETMADLCLMFPKAKYIGMTPGIKLVQVGTEEEAFIPYACWFDRESSASFESREQFEEYNWVFLRSQQAWANDMLRIRGYVVLNDILGMLGMSHSSMGAVVGWTYDAKTQPDSHIDFGCWEQMETPRGLNGAILLDFNVQGPILHAIR